MSDNLTRTVVDCSVPVGATRHVTVKPMSKREAARLRRAQAEHAGLLAAHEAARQAEPTVADLLERITRLEAALSKT